MEKLIDIPISKWFSQNVNHANFSKLARHKHVQIE